MKSGRTPEQRLAARYPPLVRAVAASVLRMPPGSPIRRAWLARAARTSFEAWLRGDYDVLRTAADPEVEVHIQQASAKEGFEVPVGLDEIYRGPDGYCESMETWADSFTDWRAEVDEVIEEDYDRFVVVGRHSGRGRASGIELEQWAAIRYLMRRGRIVRVDACFGPNRGTAVEAISPVSAR